MSFDAGTIAGKLDLDTTDFKHGIEEAHTHADTHGDKIREKMEEIRESLEAVAEVASEVAGPAFAEMGQQLQSAVAGFSEGPVIGSLNLVGIALGDLREAVQSSAEEFHTMDIEAQKAGVSVEFLDRLANVAGTAKVGVEQLGLAFKILEQQGEAAMQGSAKEKEAFDRLGISTTELAKLLDSPQELFQRVQQSIGGMIRESDRLSAAQHVLGRGGSALIPIFTMTQAQFDSLADTFDRLSGGMDASTSKMGGDLVLLENYFQKSFEGIERAAAKPVLKYLSDHIKEIEPIIEEFTTETVTRLGNAWDNVGDALQAVQPFFEPLEDELKSVLPFLDQLFDTFVDLLLLVRDELKPAFEALAPAFVPISVELDALRAALLEIDYLINKQRELSGGNEPDKATLSGTLQEESMLQSSMQKSGIMLTRQQQTEINELHQKAADDIDRYDVRDALRLEQQVVAKLKKFREDALDSSETASADSGSEQDQLNAVMAKVSALIAKGNAKLPQELGVKLQGFIEAADADVERGDIHGAIQEESKALRILESVSNELRRHTERAAVSMSDIGPAFADLTDHVHSIINSVNGHPQYDSDQGLASAGSFGGGTASGGNVINNFTVLPVDPRESARQFAMRIHGPIRDLQWKQADAMAGEALIAVARASMGGEVG